MSTSHIHSIWCREAVVAGVLGVLSIPCGLFTGIPAVLFGHIAVSKIDASTAPLKGKGLAYMGLTLGYLMIGLSALFVVFWLSGR